MMGGMESEGVEPLPPWPPHMAGAWYTREDGWHRPVRQPDGKIRRVPIPLEEIRDAGLPERPELADWQQSLVLHPQPLRNLIPRRAGGGA